MRHIPRGFLEVDLQLFHSHMNSGLQGHGKIFALQFNAAQFYIVCRFSLRKGRSTHSKLEMYTLGDRANHLPGTVGENTW